MLKRIISGESRKTRLHDEKGNLIEMSKFLAHAPLALSSGLLRLSIDHRPEIPWIAYDGIKALDNHLTKESRVLEYGSGMSTVWYAKHAKQVYSVEDYKPWYEKVTEILERSSISNCHYHLAEKSSDYAKFMSDDSEGFDLIMVDGSVRSQCIENATNLLRRGGVLYLDNSDKHSGPEGGDTRIAEDHLLKFAHKKNAKITYFTDFAPTQLFCQQGMMLKLPD